MAPGVVYLVGAGPGDPGLLTVKGQQVLRTAELVVYDHLVPPGILRCCGRTTRLRYAGKEPGTGLVTQAAINRLLVREAQAGKTVVRLKGGDPFLFGRGGEEALELAKAGIPYEIVPGVTSAIAAPACAGIPVTHRALACSVAILTGHEAAGKSQPAVRWDRLATACDTLVCLMGVSALPRIVRQLVRHGRPAETPAAIIEWGACPAQRTVTGTLSTIAKRAASASIRPPAVLVVGEVVSLRRRLAWFERRALFGKRLLVSRAAEKADALANRLERLGAEVVQLPAIELAPAASNGSFREAMRDVADADWAFFTSPEGIGWLTRRLKPYGRDVRWLSGCRIGAIGPKTAQALEQYGLHVDLVPRRFSQEGLLEALSRQPLDGKRALIFSAQESRDALATGLRRLGMRVKRIPLYRTLMPPSLTRHVAGMTGQPFDLVTATSASCVAHLAMALEAAGRPRLMRTFRFASIGPITSRAVRAHGGRVVAEASRSTEDGLVEAVVRHLRR